MTLLLKRADTPSEISMTVSKPDAVLDFLRRNGTEPEVTSSGLMVAKVEDPFMVRNRLRDAGY